MLAETIKVDFYCDCTSYIHSLFQRRETSDIFAI